MKQILNLNICRMLYPALLCLVFSLTAVPALAH